MSASNKQSSKAPILVLGLGDQASGDAALGEHLLEVVQSRWGVDERVEYVDGGTKGLMLAEVVAKRKALLVLDGLSRGREPGTVYVCRDADDWACACGNAPHEGCASEVLTAVELSGDVPPRVVVIGIEPERLGTGCGLSPAVRGAMTDAADEAVVVLGDFMALVPPERDTCTN